MRPGIILLNFGGPRERAELEPFLTALLEDVLPGPPWLKRVAAPYIARSRSKLVGPNYEQIGWSPIVATHAEQEAALCGLLGDGAPPIASGMMFSEPSIPHALDTLLAAGVDSLVAVPMFPHYSFATTQAAFSFLYDAMTARGHSKLPVHWVPAYFEHPAYLDALAATIREGIAATPGDGPIHLLFSPHGLPVSYAHRGDPYPEQVRTSARRAMAMIDEAPSWSLAWQSRVGPVKWLEPSTPDALTALAKQGVKRVCLVPISFVSDHIETLHEIDIEYAELAHHVGIEHFGRAPALNLQPSFIGCLADITRDALTQFTRYQCVRCLIPQPDAHRRRVGCPTCKFQTPRFLREGAS